MTSLSQRIAWNTVVQMLGKAASTGLGVAITYLLTHYLSHADYGIYIFALVFVMMFGTLADWGMTLITVREASKELEKAAEIIGNTLAIRLMLALGAAVTAAVLINVAAADPTTKLVTTVMSLSLVALSLKTSFQIIFQARLVMANWAVSELVANSVTITLLFFLMTMKVGLAGIIWAFLVGDFAAAGAAWLLSRRVLELKWALVREGTKYLLWEALPMGAILVVFTIYNRVDTVILAHFKGADAVADYGLAYRIFEVVVLGAAFFANAVLPVISRLAVADRAKLAVFYKKSYVVLGFLGLGAAVTTFLLAPLGIGVLGGQAYGGAIVALQILSLALVVAYFNHLNGYTLIALGKQWWSLRIAIIALVINVILNLVFIPYFSFLAAAFITFVTEALIVVLSVVAIRKELGVLPRLADVAPTVKEFIDKRGKIFDEHEV